METKDIQKLIDYISKSDLDEINIETADLKLSIKRNVGATVIQAAAPVAAAPAPAAAPSVAPAPAAEVAPVAAPVAESAPSHLIEVKSPMIGTFYRAAGPDKPNFKEVGDSVAEGDVICIVEAMKLFNEIESEVKGKIVKILVEDATPVEFDQPLFLVDPS
ncbi:acetyl-CoA carboxylase biotin carboxyl carrier protein [Jiulongibacter sediminis]|jgi:acetyl-CoA carboxylase biotin carboxyl carrier protein|uniref:Biotin carboxyl carrier protein of acetyl-CoA carboxylase n=1 Tax=Jiulongibacter sediminis TaxID=1605367 RepID=A0A0P7BIQ5_9BACT|nr:acetyl-CoA carboxylase biotin carboxyl carrier protein [Jiulongibacter sediminis]KPM47008.1 acetyl-CoA carboxylase [Jiulongibacter sediminis]TBX22350.1 acetyl-CoA carboxylase [Jiulongibacter sediminis]